jgi:hypothetical protein
MSTFAKLFLAACTVVPLLSSGIHLSQSQPESREVVRLADFKPLTELIEAVMRSPSNDGAQTSAIV